MKLLNGLALAMLMTTVVFAASEGDSGSDGDGDEFFDSFTGPGAPTGYPLARSVSGVVPGATVSAHARKSSTDAATFFDPTIGKPTGARLHTLAGPVAPAAALAPFTFGLGATPSETAALFGLTSVGAPGYRATSPVVGLKGVLGDGEFDTASHASPVAVAINTDSANLINLSTLPLTSVQSNELIRLVKIVRCNEDEAIKTFSELNSYLEGIRPAVEEQATSGVDAIVGVIEALRDGNINARNVRDALEHLTNEAPLTDAIVLPILVAVYDQVPSVVKTVVTTLTTLSTAADFTTGLTDAVRYLAAFNTGLEIAGVTIDNMIALNTAAISDLKSAEVDSEDSGGGGEAAELDEVD